MNELLKYVFDNNNLIDFVIFSRDGKIQVKRKGDDFYLYFEDANELVQYVNEQKLIDKEFIVDIENHVCCEDCNEIYLRTVDCPLCEESFSIELDDKEVECDCGCNTKFTLEITENFEAKLTLI